MLHDTFRTHRFTQARRTRTSDGSNGWTEAWATVGTVEGSLQPQSMTEVVPADQRQVDARWILYVDTDADIRRDDRLTLSHRFAGEWCPVTGAVAVFDVTGAVDWWAGSPLDHRRVDLIEVQVGT
jgi:head-tail adaptor